MYAGGIVFPATWRPTFDWCSETHSWVYLTVSSPVQTRCQQFYTTQQHALSWRLHSSSTSLAWRMWGTIHFIRWIRKFHICQETELHWLWNDLPANQSEVLFHSAEPSDLWVLQHIIFTRFAIFPPAHRDILLFFSLDGELPSTWWWKLAKDWAYPLVDICIKCDSDPDLQINGKDLQAPATYDELECLSLSHLAFEPG